MEPLFFKAENSAPGLQHESDTGASMEPLFFKAENRHKPEKLETFYLTASMEPLFFKAENPPSALSRIWIA